MPRVRIELLGGRTADAYAYGPPLRDGRAEHFHGGWDSGMFADPMPLQPGNARRLREVLTRS